MDNSNIKNKSKKIQELRAGDKIDVFVLVKNYDIKKTTAGKLYVDLNLVDKSGEINAKIWENPKDAELILNNNSIVKVRGEVIEWNSLLQLKVFKIRSLNENENIEISQLIPSAPIDTNKMYSIIKDYIDKISDLQIRSLVNNIISKYEEQLLYYPAAKKNHHSYRGGLLYHVLRMLQSGEKLCEVYNCVNSDFIYAGVILHDICKIKEMTSDEFGVVSDYTMEGKLLGHIILGVKEIDIEGQKIGLDKEKSVVLQHMILSHHYEAEYGSPKKPMTIESELLHYLDIIDARMFDFENVLKSIQDSEFSEKIWVLDNRNIYKPKINNI